MSDHRAPNAFRTLVLATTNAGKAAEFRALLSPLIDLSRITAAIPAGLGFVIAPIEETGSTFAENARIKALAAAAATGLPALADDSGLCVDALHGAPGLRSARWAGPGAQDSDLCRLLLHELASVPPEERTARFVCAVAAAFPDGEAEVAEGICEGLITRSLRGAHGFGYDPIFLIPQFGRTLAELDPGEKNRISHRASAVRLIGAALIKYGFPPSLNAQIIP